MLTGDELEQTYTVSEVAKIIKKHPDTVREMIRADQIEAVRIGRTYRMRKSVVEKLIGIDQKLQ
ncbi:MAG: helix-turn-helix domain-containing protein [Ktedonobacteraceae bacterium]